MDGQCIALKQLFFFFFFFYCKLKKKKKARLVFFLVTLYIHMFICLLQMTLLNPDIQSVGMGASFSQPDIPFCIRESSCSTPDESLEVHSESSDSPREQASCIRWRMQNIEHSYTRLVLPFQNVTSPLAVTNVSVCWLTGFLSMQGKRQRSFHFIDKTGE